MKKIKIPKNINSILCKLDNKSGFQAYVVGGAIRNQLLKLPVKDWDITTNATPTQVQEIFEKENQYVVPTGLQHGTVTVVDGIDNVEITTFRIDGKYSDGRRPDSVEFTNSLKDDLSRRDFTINALAYNKQSGIVDYFNGMQDLKDKKIKCVGNAHDRFSEDALRMLRAIRFANQLNFSLDYEIEKEIRKLKSNIQNVSVERKREEINKILQTRHSIRYFELLKELLPEIFSDNNDTYGNQLLDILNCGDLITNLTILFIYDILKLDMLEHYKYDVFTTTMVKDTISCYKVLKNDWKSFLTNANLNYYIKENLLSKYKKAVIDCATKIIMLENQLESQIAYKLSKTILDIEINDEPVFYADLDLNGYDLQEFGLNGIEIGKALDKAAKFVWANPQLNKKEILLQELGLKEKGGE